MAAPVLGQGQRRPGDRRRGRRARLRRERRLARRVGGRAARRRPERPDHARGRRQDRRRPARRGPGRGRRARRSRGSRSNRSTRPRRWPGSRAGWSRRGAARARRPRPAQPGRRAGDAAGLAVGAGGVEVRDDRDGGDRRSSSGSRRTPAGSLRPRGIHLHVGSQLGAVDAWRDAVRRGLALVGAARAGPGRRSTRSTSAAGSRSCRSDEPAPGPDAIRAGAAGAARGDPRATGGRRAWRSSPVGRSWRAPAGSWRASCTSASAAAARSCIDAGMTELIRPALYGARHPIVALTSLGRPDPADAPRRRPASRSSRRGSRARSASRPTPSASTTCRRSAGATSSRSRDAGAYAASLASTYNGRPRAPQVLLEPDGTAPAWRGGARA